MRAKREYRERESTEVAILDALVNRSEEGMTVFELRAAVSVEIDELEEALAALKADDLIVVEATTTDTLIKPEERVVPRADEERTQSATDWLRERLPF